MYMHFYDKILVHGCTLKDMHGISIEYSGPNKLNQLFMRIHFRHFESARLLITVCQLE